MSSDLAMMYGREGEALERYQRQREAGGGLQIPEDCDLCRRKLHDYEMSPQTIQWRTPERDMGEVRKYNAVFVSVRVKEVSWYQWNGTYFLCMGCRDKMRPKLHQALPYAFAALLVTSPLAWLMGGGLPLSLVMVMPALAWGLGLWWGMRSQFKGFPASSGFKVHETTFNNEGRAVVLPLAVLVAVLVPFLFSVFGPAAKKPAEFVLMNMDKGGSLDRAHIIGQRLNELDKVAPENREQLGEMIIEGWKWHRTLPDRAYPVVPLFVEAVQKELEADPKKSTLEIIEMVKRDTPRKVYERQQARGK